MGLLRSQTLRFSGPFLVHALSTGSRHHPSSEMEQLYCRMWLEGTGDWGSQVVSVPITYNALWNEPARERPPTLEGW